MSKGLIDLISILDLEQLEVNLFRGNSPKTSWQRVFGGQVIGQAMVAACRTVEGRLPHSIHCYFILPGDPQIPIIYEVERLRDGTQMALKFADGSISENSDMLFRFVEEYALLEQICHPNVLQIYDQGVTDDALFIVMEYLPGGTLKHQIGKEGMASELALRILREVVLALAEVHRTGIIHCDIKPENILLRDDGTAVLSDFGVARRVIKARHAGNVSSVVGTPYFMSPEQVLGENEDERTDIYSMGAVFYNMLTGEKPYLGDTLEEIMQKHLKAPVPQLPQQHQHLQPLLDRMMAKDKELRCSMAELLALLDELRK